jgi:hypothetical protein
MPCRSADAAQVIGGTFPQHGGANSTTDVERAHPRIPVRLSRPTDDFAGLFVKPLI